MLDSIEELNKIDDLERYRFLHGIGSLLSQNGFVVVPSMYEHSDWENRFHHAGFDVVSDFDAWSILRPPSSSSLASYTRTLENKLAAVYRSNTWNIMQPVRTLGAFIKRHILNKNIIDTTLPERPDELKGKDPLEEWRK